DELRILALVKGAQVLQAQAITENSGPFWMWRHALRRLCLDTELTDFEASVLKSLVPDIETLLNRHVPDAPLVDPQAAQLRLLTVIEDMFLRQEQVTVLFLEDLQWANESLEILKRLNRIAPHLPLLIVGTYRDDERPNLPNQLPHMNLISLNRLDKAAISDLSASIIGERGRGEQVVELLERESEGNVLFIVEVMRALAENAGQLSRIDTANLPPMVLTGGAMLQRRLKQIPADAHPLLHVAAVAGRELDLDVLRAVSPQTNLEYWLADISSMVEVQDNRYRFSHDKLREGLLSLLTADQHRHNHHELAIALEQVHPDNHTLLAFHWREWGDAAKEALYSKSAGLSALGVGSFREAITFLERTVQLAEQLQQPTIERSELEYHLGVAALSMGRTLDSIAHFEQAQTILGFPPPATNGRLALRMLRALSRQVSHRMRVDVFGQTLPVHQRHDEFELLARIGNYIGVGYSITGQTFRSVNSLIQFINWAERAGDTRNAVALSFVGLEFAGGIFGLSLPKLGAIFSRRAARLRPFISDKKALGESLRNKALLVGASGDWPSASALHEESVKLARELGDVRLLLTGQSLHLFLAYFYATEWDSLLPLTEAIRDVAARQDDAQSKGLAIGWQVLILVSMGKLEEAQALKESNRDFLDSLDEPGAQRYVLSANSHLLWRQGHFQEALAEAEKLLAIMPAVPAEPAFLTFLYALTEIYFTAWGNEPTLHQERAVQLLKMIGTYARLYPMGQPFPPLYKAWQAGIKGDGKGIQQHGAKAIQLAQQFRMPLVEGLAHYHIARFSPNPVRHEHLIAAKSIFQQLGEAWYFCNIQELLE
ncbi:MAG: hypothetical protein H7175_12015, partial [Burkholderiales bacterium]|nr:hypothetical protein [Anaerolineae bacterium]